ncbi:MAG TPA: thioredoxin domain-containing protein [Polyangiaceae bacterium]|nr:thioredoxin domain-containing protein [Polyangiaceae bacterium]
MQERKMVRTTVSGNSLFRRVSLALAGALLVMAPLGCQSHKDSKPSGPAGSSSAVSGGSACSEYAEKVCAKAGAESPACSSFRQATELMAPAACSAGVKDIAVTLDKLAAQRGECDQLVKALCDAIGPATKTCQMVTAQTASFPPAQCKEMAAHLPEVVADLQKMEAANQPLSAELQLAISANTAPGFGPENASVKVVEFSDFECPYCSRAANVVHELKQKYGDKIRFVFRQFPLSMHRDAHGAAQAALAADAQGKFWEYHDVLFANQGSLDRSSLEGHAKTAGLNLAQFKQALAGEQFKAQVEADLKLGEQAVVQGTPTMFVNGARVENPADFASVAGMIDAALAGTPPG